MDKKYEEFEKEGVDVLAVDGEGKVTYRTGSDDDTCKCSACPCCRILPDPDPYDWFCDDDVKIYCEKLEKVIARSLRPNEAYKFEASKKVCPKVNENR
ncbi:MAG: hypothetical protein MJ246_03585 [Clostridia bacterium]|nr:hypothetical protein [Clostridia bacterium]